MNYAHHGERENDSTVTCGIVRDTYHDKTGKLAISRGNFLRTGIAATEDVARGGVSLNCISKRRVIAKRRGRLEVRSRLSYSRAARGEYRRQLSESVTSQSLGGYHRYRCNE
ncbi:hypothetical protein PUN28_016408 [Cardiocondyla obscurior]|uniref:Uncharacterized protein n=1 Tax=Cardiocondyla obscurior TaxID=286306 RepID=A0AAW2ESU7_9HYME